MTPGVLLVKQWPHVQFFSGGKAKVVGEAWPDYALYLYNRPFILDAKTTVEPKTYRPDSRFKHQFEKLRLAASNGLGAFYLVHWLNHQVIELFQVHETDLWPISYPYATGVCRVAYQDNWLGILVDNYFSTYYQDLPDLDNIQEAL